MRIYLFLLVFLMAVPAAPSVAAEVQYSDEALASYISGRLKLALKSGDYKITQYCDDSGCAVVVQ